MPTSKRLNVAVVGATGMVGHEMLRVLAQRQFPSERIVPLASERSKGMSVQYNGGSLKVEELTEAAFKGIDVALFAASGDIALMFGPVAAESGALVIDNSSAWRMKENVPLVVPEVNGDDIRENEGIIANPNCCAIPLTVILNPLKKTAGLERVLVSTYQSASGAGRALVDELEEQTKAIADGKTTGGRVSVPARVQRGPRRLASRVGRLQRGRGQDRQRDAQDPARPRAFVSRRPACGCRCRSAMEYRCSWRPPRRSRPTKARTLLGNAPGSSSRMTRTPGCIPTPHDVAGKDEVYVGRIREDASTRHGLVLWIVADNLRKGAALNAVRSPSKPSSWEH